jgi:hypothetical protein
MGSKLGGLSVIFQDKRIGLQIRAEKQKQKKFNRKVEEVESPTTQLAKFSGIQPIFLFPFSTSFPYLTWRLNSFYSL